jgi:hypothetical protein
MADLQQEIQGLAKSYGLLPGFGEYYKNFQDLAQQIGVEQALVKFKQTLAEKDKSLDYIQGIPASFKLYEQNKPESLLDIASGFEQAGRKDLVQPQALRQIAARQSKPFGSGYPLGSWDELTGQLKNFRENLRRYLNQNKFLSLQESEPYGFDQLAKYTLKNLGGQ